MEKDESIEDSVMANNSVDGTLNTENLDDNVHTSGTDECNDSLSQDPLVDELKQKLQEAEQKRDEYLSMAQRSQADFDNYRRRNKSSVADAYKTSVAETIEVILPILDNLEKAHESALAAGVQDSFLKGIELVLRQFKDCLYKLDIEEIEALGLPFDPELHNAVMQIEAQEGMAENTVADVMQKGYRMNDKVIRYSMVKVAH